MQVGSGGSTPEINVQSAGVSLETARQNLKQISGSDAKIQKMNIFERVLNKISRGKLERAKFSDNNNYKTLDSTNKTLSNVGGQIKELRNRRVEAQIKLNRNNRKGIEKGNEVLKKELSDIDDEMDLLFDQVKSLDREVSTLDKGLSRTRKGSSIKANVLKLKKSIERHQTSSPGYVKYELLETARKIDEASLNDVLRDTRLDPGAPKGNLSSLQAQKKELEGLAGKGQLRVEQQALDGYSTRLQKGEVLSSNVKDLNVLSKSKNQMNQVKENYRNSPAIRHALLTSVPAVRLEGATQLSGATPAEFDHNAYGLEGEFTFSDDFKEVTVTENGETRTISRELDRGGKPISKPEQRNGQYFLDGNDADSADKTEVGETNNVRYWSVADGASNEDSSRAAAQDAVSGTTEFLKERLEQKQPTTLREAAELLLDSVDAAHKNIQDRAPMGSLGPVMGQATLSQTMLVGDYLLSLQMGDTSSFVLRQTESGYETVPLGPIGEDHDIEYSEGGVGHNAIGDDLTGDRKYVVDFRSARFAAVKLEPGDIVLSATDAIGDNLSPEEITKVAQGSSSVNDLGESLFKKLQDKVKPFLEATVLEGKSKRQAYSEAKAKGMSEVKPDHAGYVLYKHGA